MRIYWLVMSALLLFPWSLVILPAVALAYKRRAPEPYRRDRRRSLVWIAIPLVTVLAAATVVFAAEPAATPIERLHDGVRDLATGWLRFFQVIGAETVDRGLVPGLLIGSVEGSNQALRQTTRGAYDSVTFLLPVPRPRSAPSVPGTFLEVQF